jgi:hypothetical protein
MAIGISDANGGYPLVGTPDYGYLFADCLRLATFGHAASDLRSHQASTHRQGTTNWLALCLLAEAKQPAEEVANYPTNSAWHYLNLCCCLTH